MEFDKKPVLSARGLLWPIATVLTVAVLLLIYWTRGDEEENIEPVAPTEQAEVTPQPQAEETAPEVTDTANSNIPSFDIVRLSPSGAGVVAGKAVAGSDIILYADGVEVARTKADPRGEWVMILENPLPAGPTEFSLEARLGDSGPILSSDIVVVVVPEMEGAAEGEGVLAVLSPRDGNGVSRALQVPANALGQDLARTLRIETIDIQEDGSVVISGAAEAEQDVRLYLDNVFTAEAKASVDGRWVVALESLEAGAEEDILLRVDQVITDGQVTLRIEQRFDPQTGERFGRLERAVEVQPGNNLWAIARKIYGSGWRYAFIFQANAAQIRDPNLIYPGQVFALPEPQEDEQP